MTRHRGGPFALALVTAVAGTVAFGEQPAAGPEVARAVDAYLRRPCEADEFSGVVLLAREGRTFFQKACGMANREFSIPNRTDTKFNVGSISKMFTRVAIGRLAQEGKLTLEDTIAKRLPDYPGPGADRITIRHLLTMSSGLGDTFGEEYSRSSKAGLRALSDYLPLFVGKPLLFEPGARRSYSNAGYVVLGLIVERVSGRDYFSYVRENVFAPAGMRDSDWYEMDAIVLNLATGYTRRGEDRSHSGPRRKNVFTLPARGSSAGGSYSTAADLLAFDAALRGGKLLDPRWTRWIFEGRPPGAAEPESGKASGGLGVGGGAPGLNAALEIDLDGGNTIVVLSNDDPPSAEGVAKQIRVLLGMAGPKVPRRAN